METAAASTEAQITIEDGGLNPGGSRSRTASLYYTKLDGRLADGPVALGQTNSHIFQKRRADNDW